MNEYVEKFWNEKKLKLLNKIIIILLILSNIWIKDQFKIVLKFLP